MNKSALFLLIIFFFYGMSEAALNISYEKALALARSQSAAGDYDAAEKTLSNLLSRYPRNPEILAFQGRIRLWRKDYTGAINLFRRSFSLKKNPEVQNELERAETFHRLDEADSLEKSGDTAGYIRILTGLFQKNREPYESGRRLGNLYLHIGEIEQAREVFASLRKNFPDDADIALSIVRTWAEQNAEFKALSELDSLPLQWQDRDDARHLRSQLIAAIEQRASDFRKFVLLNRIAKADILLASGDYESAEKLLEDILETETVRYDAGIRLGRIYMNRRDYNRAISLYDRLRNLYPEDDDLALLYFQAVADSSRVDEALEGLERLPGVKTASRLALQGRLYERQGRLQEAISCLQASLEKENLPEIRDELARTEIALLLADATRRKAAGDLEGAEQILRKIYESGRETYESGYNLGLVLLARRQYAQAVSLFDSLAVRYPKEYGFQHLAIEARILNGDIDGARRLVNNLSPDQTALLTAERPDILYRIRRNNIRLSGGIASYSNGQPQGKNMSAALSQRLGSLTTVVQGGWTERYGKCDTQAALELYSGLGEKTERTVFLSLSVSPDASFLPRYTAGVEASQSWKDWDASVGVYRLVFRESSAFIFVPGLTCYFPYGWSINERLYFVLSNGTYSSVTTISYEPDHRLRTSASLSIGQTTERIGSSADLFRSSSYGVRLFGEYRLTPSISFGLEIYSEHRQGLYDRTGSTLFTRYWW
jgi:YaiO family outer membrane protein